MISHTRTRILCGTGLAMALAASASAQPIEQVVVTGTHIRGVAPVGSTVIGVSSDDLEKTGVTSTSDLLYRVPQFISMGSNERTVVGGTRAQNSAGNTTYQRSLNLRGISQSATLTLFDGNRHTKSAVDDSADVDMFPVSLVERIEVVADGGSAVYGSDAITGTVNVILREPKDIIETVFQAGVYDGGMDWNARLTLGTAWDEAASGIGDGGIMLAYEHSYTDPLMAEDRPKSL
jgi:iron complex outermembrane receptor protein